MNGSVQIFVGIVNVFVYSFSVDQSDETQNNIHTKIRRNTILFRSDQQSLMLEKYSYSNGLMHSGRFVLTFFVDFVLI